MPIVPDAVLEVRSPSDKLRDVNQKVALWLEAGVRLVWEVNPKTRLLTVYRPGKEPQSRGMEDTLSGEDVLPGFALSLRLLFVEE